MRNYVLMITAVFMAGCATSPANIGAAYVSPIQYNDYDCDQVAMELQRVTRRTVELHGDLDKKAGNDAAATAVGAVLFWPALFLLGGDGPETTEYARLKGERDALEQVAVQKKCSPPVAPTAASAATDAKAEKPKKKSYKTPGHPF